MAQACVELGKWPSENDLRLYGRSHSDFPSTTTLKNHFPRRSLLIDAMREWAGNNPEYAEVIDFLPEALQRGEARPESNGSIEGYVYLIRSGSFFKIGRSEQLEKRIKQIRVALPQSSTLEHVIKTDDPAGIEAYWHRRFAEKRANGEWFSLSKLDLLAFKRRKFQ